MVNVCAVCGCCTRTDIVREQLEDTLRICGVSAMGLFPALNDYMFSLSVPESLPGSHYQNSGSLPCNHDSARGINSNVGGDQETVMFILRFIVQSNTVH